MAALIDKSGPEVERSSQTQDRQTGAAPTQHGFGTAFEASGLIAPMVGGRRPTANSAASHIDETGI
jgi:hypothetical protein